MRRCERCANRHAVEALRRWLTAIATGVRDVEVRSTIRDSFRALARADTKDAFDKLKEALYKFLRERQLHKV